MDPNTTLEELRRRVIDILAAFDDERGIATSDAAELAEAFRALDTWISNGGFLPAAWTGRVPR